MGFLSRQVQALAVLAAILSILPVLTITVQQRTNPLLSKAFIPECDQDSDCGDGFSCRNHSCRENNPAPPPPPEPEPPPGPPPAPATPPSAPAAPPPSSNLADAASWKCPGPNCDKCGVSGWWGAGCGAFCDGGKCQETEGPLTACGSLSKQCSGSEGVTRCDVSTGYHQWACGNDGCYHDSGVTCQPPPAEPTPPAGGSNPPAAPTDLASAKEKMAEDEARKACLASGRGGGADCFERTKARLLAEWDAEITRQANQLANAQKYCDTRSGAGFEKCLSDAKDAISQGKDINPDSGATVIAPNFVKQLCTGIVAVSVFDNDYYNCQTGNKVALDPNLYSICDTPQGLIDYGSCQKIAGEAQAACQNRTLSEKSFNHCLSQSLTDKKAAIDAENQRQKNQMKVVDQTCAQAAGSLGEKTCRTNLTEAVVNGRNVDPVTRATYLAPTLVKKVCTQGTGNYTTDGSEYYDCSTGDRVQMDARVKDLCLNTLGGALSYQACKNVENLAQAQVNEDCAGAGKNCGTNQTARVVANIQTRIASQIPAIANLCSGEKEAGAAAVEKCRTDAVTKVAYGYNLDIKTGLPYLSPQVVRQSCPAGNLVISDATGYYQCFTGQKLTEAEAKAALAAAGPKPQTLQPQTGVALETDCAKLVLPPGETDRQVYCAKIKTALSLAGIPDNAVLSPDYLKEKPVLSVRGQNVEVAVAPKVTTLVVFEAPTPLFGDGMDQPVVDSNTAGNFCRAHPFGQFSATNYNPNVIGQTVYYRCDPGNAGNFTYLGGDLNSGLAANEFIASQLPADLQGKNLTVGNNVNLTGIYARDPQTRDGVSYELLKFLAGKSDNLGGMFGTLPDCSESSAADCRTFRGNLKKFLSEIGAPSDSLPYCGQETRYGWTPGQCQALTAYISTETNASLRFIRSYRDPGQILAPIGGASLQQSDLVASLLTGTAAIGGTTAVTSLFVDSGYLTPVVGGLFTGGEIGNRILVDRMRGEMTAVSGLPCAIDGSSAAEATLNCSVDPVHYLLGERQEIKETQLDAKIKADLTKPVNTFRPQGPDLSETELSKIKNCQSGSETLTACLGPDLYTKVKKAYVSYFITGGQGGDEIIKINAQQDATKLGILMAGVGAILPAPGIGNNLLRPVLNVASQYTKTAAPEIVAETAAAQTSRTPSALARIVARVTQPWTALTDATAPVRAQTTGIIQGTLDTVVRDPLSNLTGGRVAPSTLPTAEALAAMDPAVRTRVEEGVAQRLGLPKDSAGVAEMYRTQEGLANVAQRAMDMGVDPDPVARAFLKMAVVKNAAQAGETLTAAELDSRVGLWFKNLRVADWQNLAGRGLPSGVNLAQPPAGEQPLLPAVPSRQPGFETVPPEQPAARVQPVAPAPPAESAVVPSAPVVVEAPVVQKVNFQVSQNGARVVLRSPEGQQIGEVAVNSTADLRAALTGKDLAPGTKVEIPAARTGEPAKVFDYKGNRFTQMKAYYHYTNADSAKAVEQQQLFRTTRQSGIDQIKAAWATGDPKQIVSGILHANNLEGAGIYVTDIPPAQVRPGSSGLAEALIDAPLKMLRLSKNIGVPEENLGQYFIIYVDPETGLATNTLQNTLGGIREWRLKATELSFNDPRIVVEGPFTRTPPKPNFPEAISEWGATGKTDNLPAVLKGPLGAVTNLSENPPEIKLPEISWPKFGQNQSFSPAPVPAPAPAVSAKSLPQKFGDWWEENVTSKLSGQLTGEPPVVAGNLSSRAVDSFEKLTPAEQNIAKNFNVGNLTAAKRGEMDFFPLYDRSKKLVGVAISNPQTSVLTDFLDINGTRLIKGAVLTPGTQTPILDYSDVVSAVDQAKAVSATAKPPAPTPTPAPILPPAPAAPVPVPTLSTDLPGINNKIAQLTVQRSTGQITQAEFNYQIIQLEYIDYNGVKWHPIGVNGNKTVWAFQSVSGRWFSTERYAPPDPGAKAALYQEANNLPALQQAVSKIKSGRDLPGDPEDYLIVAHFPGSPEARQSILQNGLWNVTGRDTLLFWGSPTYIEEVSKMTAESGEPILFRVPRKLIGAAHDQVGGHLETHTTPEGLTSNKGLAIYNPVTRSTNPQLFDQIAATGVRYDPMGSRRIIVTGADWGYPPSYLPPQDIITPEQAQQMASEQEKAIIPVVSAFQNPAPSILSPIVKAIDQTALNLQDVVRGLTNPTGGNFKKVYLPQGPAGQELEESLRVEVPQGPPTSQPDLVPSPTAVNQPIPVTRAEAIVIPGTDGKLMIKAGSGLSDKPTLYNRGFTDPVILVWDGLAGKPNGKPIAFEQGVIESDLRAIIAGGDRIRIGTQEWDYQNGQLTPATEPKTAPAPVSANPVTVAAEVGAAVDTVLPQPVKTVVAQAANVDSNRPAEMVAATVIEEMNKALDTFLPSQAATPAWWQTVTSGERDLADRVRGGAGELIFTPQRSATRVVQIVGQATGVKLLPEGTKISAGLPSIAPLGKKMGDAETGAYLLTRPKALQKMGEIGDVVDRHGQVIVSGRDATALLNNVNTGKSWAQNLANFEAGEIDATGLQDLADGLKALSLMKAAKNPEPKVVVRAPTEAELSAAQKSVLAQRAADLDDVRRQRLSATAEIVNQTQGAAAQMIGYQDQAIADWQRKINVINDQLSFAGKDASAQKARLAVAELTQNSADTVRGWRQSVSELEEINSKLKQVQATLDWIAQNPQAANSTELLSQAQNEVSGLSRQTADVLTRLKTRQGSLQTIAAQSQSRAGNIYQTTVEFFGQNAADNSFAGNYLRVSRDLVANAGTFSNQTARQSSQLSSLADSAERTVIQTARQNEEIGRELYRLLKDKDLSQAGDDLVKFNPNGCSDCSLVEKLTDAAVAQARAAKEAGNTAEADRILGTARNYLSHHMGNEAFRTAMIAKVEEAALEIHPSEIQRAVAAGWYQKAAELSMETNNADLAADAVVFDSRTEALNAVAGLAKGNFGDQLQITLNQWRWAITDRLPDSAFAPRNFRGNVRDLWNRATGRVTGITPFGAAILPPVPEEYAPATVRAEIARDLTPEENLTGNPDLAPWLANFYEKGLGQLQQKYGGEAIPEGILKTFKEIYTKGTYKGFDIGSNLPGRFNYNNFIFQRRTFAEYFIDDPAIADAIAQDGLNAIHGSGAGSLLGVAQMGLAPQEAVRDQYGFVATGERVYGSTGINSNGVSYAQIYSPATAIDYAKKVGKAINRMAIEDGIQKIQKTLAVIPGSIFEDSAKLTISQLQKTAEFLDKPNKTPQEQLQERLLRENFPVIYAAKVSPDQTYIPGSDITSEFVFQGIARPEIVFVPEAKIDLVKKIFADAGQTKVKISSLERLNDTVSQTFQEPLGAGRVPAETAIQIRRYPVPVQKLIYRAHGMAEDVQVALDMAAESLRYRPAGGAPQSGTGPANQKTNDRWQEFLTELQNSGWMAAALTNYPTGMGVGSPWMAILPNTVLRPIIRYFLPPQKVSPNMPEEPPVNFDILPPTPAPAPSATNVPTSVPTATPTVLPTETPTSAPRPTPLTYFSPEMEARDQAFRDRWAAVACDPKEEAYQVLPSQTGIVACDSSGFWIGECLPSQLKFDPFSEKSLRCGKDKRWQVYDNPEELAQFKATEIAQEKLGQKYGVKLVNAVGFWRHLDIVEAVFQLLPPEDYRGVEFRAFVRNNAGSKINFGAGGSTDSSDYINVVSDDSPMTAGDKMRYAEVIIHEIMHVADARNGELSGKAEYKDLLDKLGIKLVTTPDGQETSGQIRYSRDSGFYDANGKKLSNFFNCSEPNYVEVWACLAEKFVTQPQRFPPEYQPILDYYKRVLKSDFNDKRGILLKAISQDDPETKAAAFPATVTPTVPAASQTSNSYPAVAVTAGDGRPAAVHADLNPFNVRGYSLVTEFTPEQQQGDQLTDLSGRTDGRAPKLNTLLAGHGKYAFTDLYQVYDWNWGVGPNGARGSLRQNFPVTAAGIAVVPNETVQLPQSGVLSGNKFTNPYTFGTDLQAVVLYVCPDGSCLTVAYHPDDSVVTPDRKQGYALHLENLTVDPELLSRYNAMDAAGRKSLPGLKGGQIIGKTKGPELLVSVRDSGMFMDPTSRKDWWAGGMMNGIKIDKQGY